MLSSAQGALPPGSELEIVLLVIDERYSPQQLLVSEKILVTGKSLPFRLLFNPSSFLSAGSALHIELHARVIRSDQLAQPLHSLRIGQPTTHTLGELYLERAP